MPAGGQPGPWLASPQGLRQAGDPATLGVLLGTASRCPKGALDVPAHHQRLGGQTKPGERCQERGTPPPLGITWWHRAWVRGFCVTLSEAGAVCHALHLPRVLPTLQGAAPGCSGTACAGAKPHELRAGQSQPWCRGVLGLCHRCCDLRMS